MFLTVIAAQATPSWVALTVEVMVPGVAQLAMPADTARPGGLHQAYCYQVKQETAKEEKLTFQSKTKN